MWHSNRDAVPAYQYVNTENQDDRSQFRSYELGGHHPDRHRQYRLWQRNKILFSVYVGARRDSLSQHAVLTIAVFEIDRGARAVTMVVAWIYLQQMSVLKELLAALLKVPLLQVAQLEVRLKSEIVLVWTMILPR